MTKSLRERLLDQRLFRTRTIVIPDGPDGETLTVKVRSPTVGQRNAMMGDIDAAGNKVIGPARLNRMVARAIIACSLDPDTGLPIFTPEDEALILESPAGGWADKLSEAALQTEEDAVASAKN